ncbi:MAG: hypothetical protein WDW36_005266 [Sanguina aurantia]
MARAYPLLLHLAVEKAASESLGEEEQALMIWVRQALYNGSYSQLLLKLRQQPQVVTAYGVEAPVRDAALVERAADALLRYKDSAKLLPLTATAGTDGPTGAPVSPASSATGATADSPSLGSPPPPGSLSQPIKAQREEESRHIETDDEARGPGSSHSKKEMDSSTSAGTAAGKVEAAVAAARAVAAKAITTASAEVRSIRSSSGGASKPDASTEVAEGAQGDSAECVGVSSRDQVAAAAGSALTALSQGAIRSVGYGIKQPSRPSASDRSQPVGARHAGRPIIRATHGCIGRTPTTASPGNAPPLPLAGSPDGIRLSLMLTASGPLPCVQGLSAYMPTYWASKGPTAQPAPAPSPDCLAMSPMPSPEPQPTAAAAAHALTDPTPAPTAANSRAPAPARPTAGEASDHTHADTRHSPSDNTHNRSPGTDRTTRQHGPGCARVDVSPGAPVHSAGHTAAADTHTASGAQPASASDCAVHSSEPAALPASGAPGSGGGRTAAAGGTHADGAQEGPRAAGAHARSESGATGGADGGSSSEGGSECGTHAGPAAEGRTAGSKPSSDGEGRSGSDGGASASAGGYLGWVPGVYGSAVSRLTDYSNLSSAAVSMLTDSSAWSRLTSLSGQALGGGGGRGSPTNLAGPAGSAGSAGQGRRHTRVQGDAGVAGGGGMEGSGGGDESGSGDDSVLADMAEVLIGRPAGDTTTATQLQPTMPPLLPPLPQRPAPTLLDLMASEGPLSSTPFLPSMGDGALQAQPNLKDAAPAAHLAPFRSSPVPSAARQRTGSPGQPVRERGAMQHRAAVSPPGFGAGGSVCGSLGEAAGRPAAAADGPAASGSYGHTIRLIVEPGPTASDKQLWDQQHGICPGCRAALPAPEVAGPVVWGSKARQGPRRCSYTGKLYCPECHTGQAAPIPSRVLGSWDFSPLPVCCAAAEYLASTRTQPLLCLSALNPTLLNSVPELDKAARQRETIVHRLAAFAAEARADTHSPQAERYRALLAFGGTRRYLLEGLGFWSMRDLQDLCEGSGCQLSRWLTAMEQQAAALATGLAAGPGVVGSGMDAADAAPQRSVCQLHSAPLCAFVVAAEMGTGAAHATLGGTLR